MPGVTVTSVEPANGQVGIYRNRPATVRIQNADSMDYTKIETLHADFAAGTLIDVRARTSDDLVLDYAIADSYCISLTGTSSYGTITANAALDVGTGDFTIEMWIRPTVIGTNQRQLWSERTNDSNYVECDIQTNGKLHLQAATGGTNRVLINGTTALQINTTYHVAFVVKRSSATLCKVYLDGVDDTSGTPTTGTTDLTLNKDVIIGRWTSGTPLYYAGKIDEIRLWKSARTQAEVQAVMRYELAGNESNLAGYWKCNENTGSAVDDGSPNSNTLNLTSCSWSTLTWITGGTYQGTGNRVSPTYSLSSVGKAGGTRIEWDQSLPAGTTLAVSASLVSAAGPWDACANGGVIPGIDEGDDLSAADIWLKQELATTNVSVTPVLSEVRLIFRPVMPELVEIVVNGVSMTIANGGLTYWNTTVYSGGVIVDCHEDVWFATLLPWWDYGAMTVDLVVKHNAVEKSATTFTTEEFESFWANGYSNWMANALGGAYDGPMAGFGHYFVSTIEPWLIRGEFHYNVQGAPFGAFDAYYYVAHVFSMDAPASGIVGQPCPSDTPASGIVQGWTPSDTPASGIVQGWMRRDYPASGIAGVRVLKDEPASGIVGRRTQSDTPGSGVVYQVNLNNTIELRVLSVEEAAALAELGISFE